MPEKRRPEKRQPGTRRSLLAAVAGAALAAPALRRAATQPAPLSLGALFPLSGALAVLGDETFRGLDLAVDERNAIGGLLGRPIRLVKADAADPAQAASEARRLLAAGVGAVFGSYASPLAVAASQVTELAGVPYFELGAVADAVTERGFKYLFRACPPGAALGALAVDAVCDALAPLWAVAPGRIKVAVLNEDGLYGTAIAGTQVAACRVRGVPVVETLAYPAAGADLSSVVQRLRAAGADVVLHTAYQGDTALFFQAMRGAGWAPRMVVGAGGGYSLRDTASTVGEGFEGVMNVDFPQYAMADPLVPGAGDVRAPYERKYGTRPRSGHSLAACTGARLFLDALERAGGLDKDQVRAAVLAMDVPAGGTANGWGARFDDTGQNIRAQPVLLQWQGGALVAVAPRGAALARLRPALGG